MASSWSPGQASQRVDKGYSVKSPAMAPDEAGQATKGANAYLENSDGARVFLWVNNVEAQFAMTGSTAQSHRYRRFYSHNFAQPTCSISGQCPNQYEMGRLSEFVRACQLNQLNDTDVLKFKLFTTGESTTRPLQKGKHKQISIQGYILNMGRGAERFINAPDYTFDFAITRADNLLGINDQSVSRVRLTNIIDAVRGGDYVKSKKQKDKKATNGDGDGPIDLPW